MTHYPVESTELMPEDFYERVFTHGYETHFQHPKPEGLDQSFIWQMKDGERLVAAMNGKIRYQAMEIENLAIDPDYQGQGLGSQFIDYAKDYAHQVGVTSILLTTRTYQAKDFYLKHGFEVYGFLEDVPMPGVGVYYMIYRLK